MAPALAVRPGGFGCGGCLHRRNGAVAPHGSQPLRSSRYRQKQPAKAETLCQQLKTINAGGLSVYSSTGLGQVAASQGITTADAEIFVTYVVGLYCPDVT